MRVLFFTVLAFLFCAIATAQKTISFPTDDGVEIYADLYGKGTKGAILARGGVMHEILRFLSAK